jgi:hypothetical protein
MTDKETLLNTIKDVPSGRIGELYKLVKQRDSDYIWADFRKNLSQLTREGVVSIEQCYCLVEGSKKTCVDLPNRQDTIWSVIRCLAKVKRVVDVEDIILLSEVPKAYAMKYIRVLENLGFVASRPTGLAVLDKAMKQVEAPVFLEDGVKYKWSSLRPSDGGSLKEVGDDAR